jgi:predicted phage terminase large subunit-like protein
MGSLTVVRNEGELVHGDQIPETLNDELLGTQARIFAEFKAMILDNPYIPIRPTVKQAQFLMCPQKEVLFGGAAGGAKSYGLLAAALKYAHVPGGRALILRRTFKQLSVSGGIIATAAEWLGTTNAKWKEQDKTWTLPNGFTLQFGHMEHENSKLNYQGAGYDFIGFDELTLFTRTQYTYMFRSLGRRSGEFPIPPQIRSTANPGGLGHDWVKARFIDVPNTMDSLYIPSTYLDNPYIDQTAYAKTLDELDPVLRRQQKYGDWSAKPAGKMFKHSYFTNIIEMDELPKDLEVIRFWDKASTEQVNSNDPDFSAGALVGVSKSTKLIYIIDLQHFQADPASTLDRIQNTRDMDGRKVPVREELEPGSSAKILSSKMSRDMFLGYDFESVRPVGSKTVRATPFQRQAAKGHIYLVRAPWNQTLVNEFVAFPTKGVHDDIVDAVCAAFNTNPLVNAEEIVVDSKSSTPTTDETVSKFKQFTVKGTNRTKGFDIR